MEAKMIPLIAPLSGRTVPLDQVPDPVFAGKTVGDGLAIDPISETLLAPVKGVIKHIHPSCHALTIKSREGLEILIHIGLDTVSLKSKGFTLLAKVGDEIQPGMPLLKFDADYIGDNATSLLTIILVTNPEILSCLEPQTGKVEAGKDPVMYLKLKSETVKDNQGNTGEEYKSELITVLNPQGLHARPAAVLAKIAKKFTSNVTLHISDTKINCKSVVSIMAAEIANGDKVTIAAKGNDAETAVKELREALLSGLGEEVTGPQTKKAQADNTEKPADNTEKDPNLIKGNIASPGMAVGKIFQLKRPEYNIKEQGGYVSQERRTLDHAIEQAKSELECLEKSMLEKADATNSGIFSAHREILDDPNLAEIAHAGIGTGKSAAFAWKQAYTAQSQRLAGLANKMLSARATDITDVGERVLRLIMGKVSKPLEIPDGSIIIGEELTPSDTASLDKSKVAGIATVLGGTTSHMAILARTLDLPALTGISPKSLEIPNYTPAILDCTKGILELNPTPDKSEKAAKDIKDQKEIRKVLLAKAGLKAVTLDDHQVSVLANIASQKDSEEVVSFGGEGVGLLRTEFLFIERSTPPSQEEQSNIYSNIISNIGPEKEIVIRALDVGGDKPLSYLPISTESNPFLGERGIRVLLEHESYLRTQFRAVLKAAQNSQTRIMLPMVTQIDEFRKAKAIFRQEAEKLGVKEIPLGIMIEVPAAALKAEILAQEAEFFSIGTNDLTQYTLAIDRGHPKLANLADSLHPSVLELIKLTVSGAHKHNRHVCICGGVASDVEAVPVLVGLGLDALSVTTPAIPAVKERIRNLNYSQCRQLAENALKCENGKQVREITNFMLGSKP